jgi:hypothetical protein
VLVRNCGIIYVWGKKSLTFFGFQEAQYIPSFSTTSSPKLVSAGGVRISGFVSSVICAIASLMVSSPFIQKKAGPYFVADKLRFALLATGSVFVALGEFITKSFRYTNYLTFPVRSIHPPFIYIVEYTKDLSVPDHMAFYALSVMNASGALGQIALVYLSDRLGHFNLTPSAFLTGLVSRLLVLCKITRLCNAVFCCLRIHFRVFRIGD